MNIEIETSLDILDFIKNEIPFDKLEKDKGIAETNTINNSDISIGVSYETNEEDGKDIYIYNVFIESEYINISNTGNKEDKIPISVIDEIRDVVVKHFDI